MLFLKKETLVLRAINSHIIIYYRMEEMSKNVIDHMLKTDAFSNWLGIQLLEIKEGYSKIKMIVREEMLNGLNVVHGGIAFSLADSAFAFACNNRNNLSLALETSISFLKPVFIADELIAEAKEIRNGKSTGVYLVEITNQHNQLIALFKGTCFRTGKKLV
jgi:acyl-CoA thioesterase